MEFRCQTCPCVLHLCAGWCVCTSSNFRVIMIIPLTIGIFPARVYSPHSSFLLYYREDRALPGVVLLQEVSANNPISYGNICAAEVDLLRFPNPPRRKRSQSTVGSAEIFFIEGIIIAAARNIFHIVCELQGHRRLSSRGYDPWFDVLSIGCNLALCHARNVNFNPGRTAYRCSRQMAPLKT